MMTDRMFSPEQYVEARRPFGQASTLPGWCYFSPEWYAREVETIFLKEWLCIGREDQIPNPGDFLSIEIIGRPMIAVRDESGRVRVHSSLCRHRGAILTEESGHCGAFVCPYHGWVYALDGTLLRTPGRPAPMDGAEGFNPKDYGLTPIRSDTWDGFVFVIFDGDAPSLGAWLGDLPAFLTGYDLGSMRWVHRDVYEVACNWKLWLENAFENYHVATIHRRSYNSKNPQSTTFEKTQGSWEAMFSKQSIVAYSDLPAIPSLDAERAAGLYHIWVRPSLQLILTASYMKFRQYLPDGPGHLRLYENWAFPEGTISRPDFADIVGPSYYHKYSAIICEDLGINPVVQRGMSSGAYRPGRYSTEEYIVHRIANYVLDRVVGPDDAL